jgi:hypothetical protein
VRCHRHRVTDGVDEFAASRVVLVGVGVAIRFFFFFAHPRCWCERLLFSISVSLYVIEKNELKIKNGTSFFCSRASTPGFFLPLGTARYTAVTAVTAGVR